MSVLSVEPEECYVLGALQVPSAAPPPWVAPNKILPLKPPQASGQVGDCTSQSSFCSGEPCFQHQFDQHPVAEQPGLGAFKIALRHKMNKIWMPGEQQSIVQEDILLQMEIISIAREESGLFWAIALGCSVICAVQMGMQSLYCWRKLESSC